LPKVPEEIIKIRKVIQRNFEKRVLLVQQSISPGCNGILLLVSLTRKRYNGKQEVPKTQQKTRI
jgi:hypothetical protein